ncbi:non-ribosomal peptide synthetase [Rhodococcus sp. Z13]|uniref:Non-ribosomal peptide synthetase n=1 Tax=Rhodococcus sacchari TaxID=2962047 RepID=A0ACD4DIS9_9NOCA|nr:non-ribosomal peptide synthetase [Rhodococcus sp. Z13]UYP19946.1 non-ribosomal peptide synthetase [Rhodococcus sp. Z13]
MIPVHPIADTHTVRDRFVLVADTAPDATAVVSGGESLTYGELLERTTDRARAIVARVPDPRQPVALDTAGDLDTLVALVSVLRSGHPLVLLDSQLPEDRRAEIHRRSGGLRFSPADVRSLPAADVPLRDIGARDPVTLLFTSGSTGTPKAVRQGHRLWLNQAGEFGERLGIGPGERVGLPLPLAFGGGMDVVISALLNGAALHVIDPRQTGIDAVPGWLADTRPTTLHTTPSLLRSILKVCGPDVLRGVRLVTTCGEPVHGDDVRALLERLDAGSTYCNLSGSSETGNIAFAAYDTGSDVPAGILPAGEPASRKTVRLVDEDGAEVEPGRIGTLVIESPFIAEGYFTDADGVLAGDPDAFGRTADGLPVFRTGDLGRFDTEGRLHLVGRRDDAVKVRGYLVEPNEVAAALRSLPSVDDAVVTTHRDGTAVSLVGYAAVDPDVRAPSEADLRRELRAALPVWMVPGRIVLLPALPRNERGKVDRGALPPPPGRPAHVEPGTGTERDLAGIWAEILGLDSVGRDDDFVSLGGDSLQTQQMLARVGDRFGIETSSATLAYNPTLRQFARHIDASAPGSTSAATGAGSTGSVLVALQTTGTRTPVFAFAGAGSTALALLPLARELGPDQPVYGLQARGLERRGLPDWTIRSAARRYLRHIRRIQPHGPYFFVGHSLGGVIAMDVARLLEARGETVSAVVCLDTILDGPLTQGGPELPRRSEPAPAAPEPAEPARSKADLWRTRARLLTAGVVQYPARTQWSLFHELGRRVALMHRFRPWNGHLEVVMAEDNPDDPQWWPAIAPNVVSVERVAGDHVGMLRPPHVARTAAHVRAALGRVRP